MIVRTLTEVIGTEADVKGPNWNSWRLLLARDRMGFSFHDTLMDAGTETNIWYANHLEAVYTIEGSGEIEGLDSGQTHALAPGTLYALDGHEKHIVRAATKMRFICVFTPPLTGAEVHDENGTYPLASP